ncbi:MAG TPA: hypothetical protein VKU90_12645 [Caulobacteraceae bacterium]|nr:hypothetical protein [Caulobacteraceae bacterium]
MGRALERLGARDIVISSDLALDAASAAHRVEPADPGAAVDFDLDGRHFALASDGFTTVFDNLIALGRHVESAAAMEQHGVATLSEILRAFVVAPLRGDWRDVLGDLSTSDEVGAIFRKLSATCHPDTSTGSHERMARLTRARDEALQDLRSRPSTGAPTPTPAVETFMFEGRRAFAAMRAAEQFLDQRGFSYGQSEPGKPRGIALGAFDIPRWSDLGPAQRAALDGEMAGDMRQGPVSVRLSAAALTRAALPSKKVITSPSRNRR